MTEHHLYLEVPACRQPSHPASHPASRPTASRRGMDTSRAAGAARPMGRRDTIFQLYGREYKSSDAAAAAVGSGGRFTATNALIAGVGNEGCLL